MVTCFVCVFLYFSSKSNSDGQVVTGTVVEWQCKPLATTLKHWRLRCDGHSVVELE